MDEVGEVVPVQEGGGARPRCSMRTIVQTKVLDAERPAFEIAVEY